MLTTNLRGNIDEAFIRRLDCVIEFPHARGAERLRDLASGPSRLRRRCDADVDLPFLARKFKLAGGHIRNIALTAAFLAGRGRAADRHAATWSAPPGASTRSSASWWPKSDFEQYYALLKER